MSGVLVPAPRAGFVWRLRPLTAPPRVRSVCLPCLEEEWPRVGEVPFDSERKRMTTLHRDGDEVVVLTKGAPETVFWIRKAIGWALRQHARTDPDAVRAFLDEMGDRLSGLSRREAAKHL